MTDSKPSITRRALVKSTGALSALVAAGGAASGAMIASPDKEAHADSDEKIIWTHCAVNCGGCCALRAHVKDGVIQYVETDDRDVTDPTKSAMRACLRGRSIRRWLQSPERLNVPLRRVKGTKRGEGKYEEISWEEAIDTIASEMKRIKEKYGNEAFWKAMGSGVEQGLVHGAPVERLLNAFGGYLGSYGNYSHGQLSAISQYVYGDDLQAGSTLGTIQDNQLIVMFGNSPADTRMGGNAAAYDLAYAREHKNARIISIDCRKNDTLAGQGDEWIPIVPGTDGALANALAYEIITNGWADEDFLHKYCVGYDEETLPESAKGQHASYKAYVLGEGPDGTPKTPEWACEICKVPVARIKQLAKEMAEADPLFVCQGWGIQRRSNGEQGARAVMTLPQLLGQIGKPGTNDGRRENPPLGGISSLIDGMPGGENPVQVSIPIFEYVDAIDHPETMTDLNAGVKGAKGLKVGIKFIFNYAGNCLTNQHSDINHTHDVLQDESKCEFIVTSELFMTDSAKYSDIILPDLSPQEQYSVANNAGYDAHIAVVYGEPVYEPQFERRGIYEVCEQIAEKLGIHDEYTGGKTRTEWLQELVANAREAHPEIPTWEEGYKDGIWHGERKPVIALEEFIADPVAHPLGTPSGKIEIYSEDLANLAKTWELGEGDAISAIPSFEPGFESYRDVTDEYPLMIMGFHYKAHAHSSYANNAIVQEAAHHVAWVNPLDAEERGIADGDTIYVWNDRGKIAIEAKVTPRIIPGVVAIPEGSWHQADMNGDRIDKGGCINTLTINRPSPLAKCNPQHSNIGQIAKA